MLNFTFKLLSNIEEEIKEERWFQLINTWLLCSNTVSWSKNGQLTTCLPSIAGVMEMDLYKLYAAIIVECITDHGEEVLT